MSGVHHNPWSDQIIIDKLDGNLDLRNMNLDRMLAGSIFIGQPTAVAAQRFAMRIMSKWDYGLPRMLDCDGNISFVVLSGKKIIFTSGTRNRDCPETGTLIFVPSGDDATMDVIGTLVLDSGVSIEFPEGATGGAFRPRRMTAELATARTALEGEVLYTTNRPGIEFEAGTV